MCRSNEAQTGARMLNVKLEVQITTSSESSRFEIIGEVQITTVGYLQLRGVAKLVRGSRR